MNTEAYLDVLLPSPPQPVSAHEMPHCVLSTSRIREPALTLSPMLQARVVPGITARHLGYRNLVTFFVGRRYSSGPAVGPGDSSRTFFIRTNATAFVPGGIIFPRFNSALSLFQHFSSSRVCHCCDHGSHSHRCCSCSAHPREESGGAKQVLTATDQVFSPCWFSRNPNVHERHDHEEIGVARG